VALSIKNPEAERIVAEISKKTGETYTKAVIVALQERLERLTGRRKGPNLVEAIMRISEECRKLPDIDNRAFDEILGYKKNGSFES
jgi:antitoxin VapB